MNEDSGAWRDQPGAIQDLRDVGEYHYNCARTEHLDTWHEETVAGTKVLEGTLQIIVRVTIRGSIRILSRPPKQGVANPMSIHCVLANAVDL